MRIAVSLASMSARFCSTGPPFMPEPDDVDERQHARPGAVDHLLLELAESSATRRRPTSTSVVWPLRNEWLSGWTAVSPLLRYASFSVPKNTCA